LLRAQTTVPLLLEVQLKVRPVLLSLARDSRLVPLRALARLETVRVSFPEPRILMYLANSF
jgi:hypothetical protein